MTKCFSVMNRDSDKLFIMQYVTFIYQCISYFKYKICSQIVALFLHFAICLMFMKAHFFHKRKKT